MGIFGFHAFDNAIRYEWVEKALYWKRADGSMWTHENPRDTSSKIVPYQEESYKIAAGNKSPDHPVGHSSKMLDLAEMSHKKQKDRGGKPYIQHCLAVMDGLRSTDDELKSIALGHDLLEDTNVTPENLKEIGFSSRVIDGIKAMTKRDGMSSEEYEKQVLSNRDAIRVKMSDLRHNMDPTRLKKEPTQKDIDRMNKYKEFYERLERALKKEDGRGSSGS